MQEIERKWLVKAMPDLSGVSPVQHERYFLYNQDGVEMRIQKEGDVFTFERKSDGYTLTSEKIKFDISSAEFETLKQSAIKKILRTNYVLQKEPEISLKVYHGDYEGLVRVEVEFNSEEEAQSYTPPAWFGREITDSPLGRDKKLAGLGQEEFRSLLATLSP
jgi:adenylate cyclase